MKNSEIIKQIVDGNKLFTNSHDKDYFNSFNQKQTPYITLVSCSDSRVPLNALMPDTSNKVFSIQNIGNQILSTEGSVDYGIFHLKTPVLMILGHSDCGAIKAYLKGFNEETYNIKHELDFLKPLINKYIDEQGFESVLSNVIEKNLDYQVNIAFKKYRQLILADKLTVVAAYYDFNEEFHKGFGKIIIVNVNKQKTENELRNLELFEKLSPSEKEYFIARI